MTDLAGACALCGVHRQADKDGCGEPDCPEQDEHGWVFLPPHERADAQARFNAYTREQLDEVASMPRAIPILAEWEFE